MAATLCPHAWCPWER